MKVAIIGSGIAGLMAARTLHQAGADITVYEKSPRIGGHVHTDVRPFNGEDFPFEIGVFMFDPKSIHPKMYALAEELGMTLSELDLSVTHESKAQDIFWTTESSLPPAFRNFTILSSLMQNGSPRRNLKYIYDVYRFINQVSDLSSKHPLRLSDFKSLQASGEYGADMFNHWLYSHLLCWWGVPEHKAPECSLDVITDSMYRVTNNPQYIFKEGVQTFIERITAPFKDRLQVGVEVKKVLRSPSGIEIGLDGETKVFSHVIFATPPSETLKLLASPKQEEQELLSQFETVTTTIYFHKDTSWMPKKRKWALINFIQEEKGHYVTFWHGKLQKDHVPYFITWGDQLKEVPDPDKTLKVLHMIRTIPTMGYRENTCKFGSIQGMGNIWHCGAHVDHVVSSNHMPVPSLWHENAFLSGVDAGNQIAKKLKRELPCPVSMTT
jgi:predicted NAD/FAD-binding protein